ncbi:MAG: molybdopterin cofactor-binding domain-containing protein [Paracoccaceae bacterium]
MGRVTRRIFLGLGVAAAGGLAVGTWWVRAPHDNPLEDGLAEGETTFNPWLKIAEDGTITVIVPRAEMGQGVTTTLAALVAEELEVPLSAVTVDPGPADPAYHNAALLASGAAKPWATGWTAELARDLAGTGAKVLGLQITGGSTSTIDAYETMRRAGATARVQLVRAAAARWDVEAAGLRAEDGAVVDPASGERLAYAELAAAAGALDAPGDVDLKAPEDWRLLGRSLPRVDMEAKCSGAPIFAIDEELPEMLHATVRISPRFGVGAASVATEAALKVPGVLKVVPLETSFGRGFGVVAANTWAAFKGAEALEIEWEPADYPADDAAQGAALAEGLASGEGFEAMAEGDAPAFLASAPADEVLELDYEVPFLAHATMEPMNATARLAGPSLEVWTGTQAPGLVRSLCAAAAGLSDGRVTVHQRMMGGGFGRRAESDAAVYAALLARETDARPVKVTWSREEDMSHDGYRPRARARIRAQARPGEGLVALDVRVAAPPLIASVMARHYPSLPAPSADDPMVEGLVDQPYAHPNWRVRGVPVDLGVPVGFWRSVGHSQNAFFLETALDEVAHRAGVDPVAMRLRMMTGEAFAPARGALEAVAEMSGWGEAAEGRAKGVAFHLSFGCWTAMVAEVARRDGGVGIEKLWIAADMGRALDPRNVEAQLSGGAVFGLSAAMMQASSFADGEVQERNFGGFDSVRLDRCPEIEVRLLETAPRLGGVGEPGTPPVAPALGNALFALTGERLRSLPFGRSVSFV